MRSSPRFGCRMGAIVTLIALSACATHQAPDGGAVPEAPPVPGQSEYPATRPHTSKPAVQEPVGSTAYQPLLARAREASAKGDYEQALALLERAQRINPNGADIYLSMARVHEARGDWSQARAVAERGLLYCQSSARCNALRVYTR
ncbi:MAG: tetratricopeptide repeat protein [Pseudomonadota bacterium]